MRDEKISVLSIIITTKLTQNSTKGSTNVPNCNLNRDNGNLNFNLNNPDNTNDNAVARPVGESVFKLMIFSNLQAFCRFPVVLFEFEKFLFR